MAGDLSVANPPDRRRRVVHEHAVALGSRLDTNEDHDGVARIDELLDVEPVATPTASATPATSTFKPSGPRASTRPLSR